MRRWLVSLFCATACVAQLPSAELGCKPSLSCAQSGCRGEHQISAHLQVPLSELLTATTTACWKSACVTLVAASDAGADVDGNVRLQDQSLRLLGAGTLRDEGDGWVRIDATLPPVRQEADGGFLLLQAAQGDDYRMTVKAANGATLLDVDRTITYTELSPASAQCNYPACLAAEISLYATSRSGACTALACDGGVTVHKRFTLDRAVAERARTTFCRNERCVTSTGVFLAQVPVLPPPALRVVSSHAPDDDLDVTYAIELENAALADGDRYSLLVEDGSTVVVNVAQAAVYETSFPNGNCDPYPCRSARVELP